MAAYAGLPEAQMLIGLSYFSGRGNQKDYSEAFKWFNKAASQGDALAAP